MQKKIENDELPPELRRAIKKLHRQMDRAEAAGGVEPVSPIKNRLTGELTHFGPRRAFDGTYFRELLRASGVTNEDTKTCAYVLKTLVDVSHGDLTVEWVLGLMEGKTGIHEMRP